MRRCEQGLRQASYTHRVGKHDLGKTPPAAGKELQRPQAGARDVALKDAHEQVVHRQLHSLLGSDTQELPRRRTRGLGDWKR